ncbi:MAG: alcohol dehydrogenase catalytic domain-containing protein [Pyrinomonadaceae bacterium]|nr:alcohol dehydrogenase catalytic domain-containing protein [Pyrinomonadaceae bacterium]
MKALRVIKSDLELAEVGVPAKGDECLVRVTKSGICNTDLEIINGYAGFEGTIGHEFVGVVEESADLPEMIGKRVVGEINVGCNKCALCKSGDSRHCAERTVLGILGRDGCHAEFLTLPARNLLEVPDQISDYEAIFAEPLAAAYGITEQVEISPDTRVAVIGDGKLGILCAWSLALESKRLILIGKHRDKLRIAENENVESVTLENALKLKRSFDVVVEASGSESGFETALDLLRPRGKLVLKSTFHGKSKWEAWRIVVDEITIIGSRCGIFSPALNLLKDKKVDVEKLISEEFLLHDSIKAIEKAREKGVMKVVLSMDR